MPAIAICIIVDRFRFSVECASGVVSGDSSSVDLYLV